MGRTKHAGAYVEGRVQCLKGRLAARRKDVGKGLPGQVHLSRHKLNKSFPAVGFRNGEWGRRSNGGKVAQWQRQCFELVLIEYKRSGEG